MASEIIKLNLIPKGEMPVFHCSQFDNGRLITIELYRGEDAYEVPSGYTVELHCRKVDNNIVTLASTLVNTNVVTFTSTTQLTACNGKNLCEVAIKAADDYLIGTLNFWLEVEVDPLKGGINSTSEIHDLYEQIENITAEVIGDDYYNKTEVDNLLDAKADKSTTYTKTQVDTLLTAKADKSNVYTKAETNTLLSAKADADNVYTKAQVEAKLAAKADAATTYTKTEVDNALALKANAATTYTKTEVDTALALKANAADVYTKAETDAAIEAAIDDILPVDTAGPSAIASFTTGLALPLVKCKVGIVATGGNGTPDSPIPINGYTEAIITRCGKNMVDKNEYTHIGIGNDDGTIINSDKRLFSGMIAVVPSQNYHYFINGKTVNNEDLIINRFICYDINKTFVSRIIVPSISNKSYGFTVPSGVYYIVIDLRTSALTTDISISDIITEQFEIGTEETAYVPYNTASSTVTIAFGQTVYGGVLDVTRGKLSVTHGFNNNLSALTWTQSAQGFFIAPLPDVKYATSGSMIPDLKCSALKTVSPSSVYGLTDKSISTANGGAYLWAYDSDYSDAATFQASMLNVQLAYALATPFDIDLTPVQISALIGENNVFGDTNGNTTVKFKDTIQNYIDKKVST